MTISQFFSVLLARKWVVFASFLAVVLSALGVSLSMPKQYTGTASVVVDLRPDPVSAVMGNVLAGPAFMATQVDIMTSDRVALRVIKDLKLSENQAIRQQWQEEAGGVGTLEQWLVELLKRQLDVRPSRESNVISITYQSPDPRFAAGLANAFAQAYIATTLDLRIDPAKQFATFFGTQMREAREALEAAQQKVSAFQREKGIIATEERLDVENARLNELSSQLTQLQAISAESGSRQAVARNRSEQLQEVLSNPVIGALKADLSRGEAKLRELGQRLGDAHPQVSELRAHVSELRARIGQETQRVAGGTSVANAINQGREAQVRSALEAQRAKVLRMKDVRDEGTVLQREVENAQRLYDNLTTRMSQVSLESQNTQSFASMLALAQPPLRHSSPKVVLNMVVATFAGILLAVGTALLLELSDRRVRSAMDVVQALELPVLGALPHPRAKRFRPGNHPLPIGTRSTGHGVAQVGGVVA